MVRYKLKDKYLKSKSELYKQRRERYNKQGCLKKRNIMNPMILIK